VENTIHKTEDNERTTDEVKAKNIFFEEESEGSNYILNKLKNEFSVSKSIASKTSDTSNIQKEEINPYDEINKKADEFTEWFLNDYLKKVKNTMN